MKSIYTERAEQRAREENDARLAAALEEYARSIEADGLTYAPAYMREAARRIMLHAGAPSLTPEDAQFPAVERCCACPQRRILPRCECQCHDGEFIARATESQKDAHGE